jgi:hypothetical protein
MDVPVAMPSPAARQAVFHQALDGVNVHVPTPQPVTEVRPCDASNPSC